MTGFSIGEVESMTGVKAHILRYWEETIPALAPETDVGGHRVYSQALVDLLRRLRFLIYENGFSIQDAWKKIIQDAEKYSRNNDLMTIKKCRAELNQAYAGLLKFKRKLNSIYKGQKNEKQE